MDVPAFGAAKFISANRARFDLNQDGTIDFADYEHFVETQIGTAFVNSNLDDIFNSSDLVTVFVAAEYEVSIPGNSG